MQYVRGTLIKNTFDFSPFQKISIGPNRVVLQSIIKKVCLIFIIAFRTFSYLSGSESAHLPKNMAVPGMTPYSVSGINSHDDCEDTIQA